MVLLLDLRNAFIQKFNIILLYAIQTSFFSLDISYCLISYQVVKLSSNQCPYFLVLIDLPLPQKL